MYSAMAFASLGLVIGTLVGLSADSLGKVVIPILFTFAGGSVIAFQEKLEGTKLKVAMQGLLGLGIGSLIGVYSALLITEYRLLTPSEARKRDVSTISKPSDGKYLRRETIDTLILTEQRLRVGTISTEEAAANLRKAIDDRP
jgi:hypothetical protein